MGKDLFDIRFEPKKLSENKNDPISIINSIEAELQKAKSEIGKIDMGKVNIAFPKQNNDRIFNTSIKSNFDINKILLPLSNINLISKAFNKKSPMLSWDEYYSDKMELESNIQKQKNLIDQMIESSVKLKNELASMQQEFSKLEKKNKELTDKKEYLESTIQENKKLLKQNETRLFERLKYYFKSIENLSRNYTIKINSEDTSNTKIDKYLENCFNILREEISERRLYIERLKDVNKKLSSQRQELKERVGDNNKTILELEREKEGYMKELDECKKSITKFSMQEELLNRKISQLETNIDSYSTTLGENKSRISQLESQLAENVSIFEKTSQLIDIINNSFQKLKSGEDLEDDMKISDAEANTISSLILMRTGILSNYKSLLADIGQLTRQLSEAQNNLGIESGNKDGVEAQLKKITEMKSQIELENTALSEDNGLKDVEILQEKEAARLANEAKLEAERLLSEASGREKKVREDLRLLEIKVLEAENAKKKAEEKAEDIQVRYKLLIEGTAKQIVVNSLGTQRANRESVKSSQEKDATEQKLQLALQERAAAEQKLQLALQERAAALQERAAAEKNTQEYFKKAQLVIQEKKSKKEAAERAEEAAVKAKGEAEQKLQLAEQKLQSAEQAKGEAEQKLKLAEQDKAAALKEKEEAKQDKAAAVKAKDEAEQEKAAAVKAKERAEQEKAAAVKVKEEAEQKLELAEQEKATAEQKLQLALRDKVTAERDKAVAEKAKEDAERKIKQQQDEIESIIKTKSAYMIINRRLRKNIEDLETLLKSINTGNSALKSTIDDLRSELEQNGLSYAESLQITIESNKSLTVSNEKLKEENKKLIAEITQLRLTEEKIQGLEQEKIKAKKESDEIISKNEGLEKKIREILLANCSRVEELSLCSAENKNLKSQLANSASRLEDLYRTIAENNDTMQTLESFKKEYEGKFGGVYIGESDEKKLKQSYEDIKSLHEDGQREHEKINSDEIDIDDINLTLFESKEAIDQMQAQISSVSDAATVLQFFKSGKYSSTYNIPPYINFNEEKLSDDMFDNLDVHIANKKVAKYIKDIYNIYKKEKLNLLNLDQFIKEYEELYENHKIIKKLKNDQDQIRLNVELINEIMKERYKGEELMSMRYIIGNIRKDIYDLFDKIFSLIEISYPILAICDKGNYINLRIEISKLIHSIIRESNIKEQSVKISKKNIENFLLILENSCILNITDAGKFDIIKIVDASSGKIKISKKCTTILQDIINADIYVDDYFSPDKFEQFKEQYISENKLVKGDVILGGRIVETLFLMFFNKYVCFLIIVLLILFYFYIKCRNQKQKEIYIKKYHDYVFTSDEI